MNLYEDISRVPKQKNSIITIGTFDGFHAGHQEIVGQVVSDAAAIGARSFLITFEPHPRSVVSKDYELRLLTTLEEKLRLIEASGIENLLVIKFTPEFSRLSAEEFFVNYIIKGVGVSELVIGHDHHIGKNRDGDENKLKALGQEYDFEVKPVRAVKIDDNDISSTVIRRALMAGELEKANKLLKRNYSFTGEVVKGAMRGRKLGFPTANIKIDNPYKLIPANGIYIVKTIVSGTQYYGLMNIGLRPTFADTTEQLIEVYLLDFDGDIYGQSATVSLIRRLRDEKKFASVDDLVRQMEVDKIEAIEYLKYHN